MRHTMVFAAAVAGAAVALPGISVAQELPTTDSVTTVGRTDAGPDVPLPTPVPLWQNISISASSGPSGENPTGSMSAVNNEIMRSVSGSVTCLAVTGTTATFNVLGFFGLSTVQVVDGDPDAFAIAPTGEVDFSTGEWFSGRKPADCSPLEGATAHAVVVGDIRVIDAQPARPTSRAQCKDGGWQQFGFKNHGQCVRFVVTGRTAPPL